MVQRLVQPFIDGGYPLTAADAGGYHAILTTRAFKVVQELDAKFSTTATKRMSECDGTTIDIHHIGVQTNLLDYGYRLCGKCFVQLKEVNVLEVHACQFEGFGNGGYGTYTHDTRLDTY